MESRKDREKKEVKPTPAAADSPASGQEKVATSVWKSSERTVRRSFPGPREARALLRVAVDRAAYAELIAHAKASLDKEICGVLAGTVCEDDHGVFVHVAVAIPGAAA